MSVLDSPSMTTCYLCGEQGADTTEHVIPRCLYPANLPNDAVTLPAHARCNRFSMKDEEAFRNHIAGAIPASHPAHVLWDKTWRAIQRPEASGMKQVYYRDMISIPIEGSALHRPVVARIRTDRVERVLAKIVKGLFFRTTEELMPGADILWRFDQLSDGRSDVRLSQSFDVNGVLHVEWDRAADAPLVTMWILGFYDVMWFRAMTIPVDTATPEEIREWARVTWPGPT